MAFTTALDIANRAAQILGQPRISSFTQTTKMAEEAEFAYDKLRQAELERNLWRHATKVVVLRAIGIDTVMWTPVAWATAQSYSAGKVVSYQPTSGIYTGETYYWQLNTAEASSSLTPDNDPLFEHYTGPVAIDLYNTGSAGDGTTNSTYQAGEVVLVPATYAGGTTYALGDVVNSGGVWYVSLAAGNTGHAVTDTTKWAVWTSTGRTTKTFGTTAAGSPIPLTYPTGYSVYISLYNKNADNPVSATGNWLSIGGTINPLDPLYPLGVGPSHDLTTANAFRLPNGFLKRAPTSPKAGQMPYLGARTGMMPDDLTPEGNYFVASEPGPLVLRFVANVIDVTAMPALFCEGLAARLASATCETVTSSDAKVAVADRLYKQAMGEARRTNAIEIGPISQIESKYITVRY